MRTGHLFAGIDGLGLGLEPHGFQPAWFSEYEQAPSRVLAHHYPDVPNHGDITTVDWTQVEPVDVLTGGFPCQDLSYAGKGAGIKEGTRSGLWFEYVRAIRALRPSIVVVENVAALLTRGLDIVLADLHESGFDAEWTTLRASDVGAAHRRQRLFIVAYAQGERGQDVKEGDGGEPAVVGTVARAGGRDRAGDIASRVPVVGRGAGTLANAADAEGAGRAARRTGTDQRPRTTGLAPGDSSPAPDGNRERLQHARERMGTNGTAPATGRERAATDTDGEPTRRDSRTAPRPQTADGRRSEPDLGDRPTDGNRPTDWGEFAPAIRRWESVLGRPAPAPTVDGRLSADFVEWHMGFPQGWTDILTRNERLKALGNAVVPQCAELIGRWALQLADREQAA
jgi:DNA (cytosine-5)-methyltransferase 1